MEKTTNIIGVIDIETNCLLADAIDFSSMPYRLKSDVKLWCVSVRNLNTGEVRTLVKSEATKESLDALLRPFNIVIAHNGHKFDFVKLMLLGLIEYKIGYLGEKDLLNGREVRLLDTLIMSRLSNPDRLGGHSLGVWGQRVGDLKIDYREALIEKGALERNSPKGFEFTFYDELMPEYCEQDTLVTGKVYIELMKEFNKHGGWSYALQQEHKLADLAIRRECVGFKFDRELALANLEELTSKMTALQDKVNPLLPKKPLTQAELNSFTPPSTQLKKDGEWSSHMLNFFKRNGIEEYKNNEKYFIYKGSLYEVPFQNALETEREATIDDLDVVKSHLITLGWKPSEWKERDLTKDSKKQSISLDKQKKALERYLKETLDGKFKEQRLKILGLTEENVERELKKQLGGRRAVKVPTSPCIRVGVTKELCPNLISIGDEVSFANDVAEYYTYRHRRSAIAGGDIDEMDFDEETPNTGYLANYRESDGRIPTPSIEVGAATNRYKHISVANVPRASSLFGKEMRSMFGCGEGYVQFGFDYASLEARIEGHYVYDYEGGAELAVSLLAEKPNDIHCYSEDTEILTEEGWKSFGEVSTKIKVAQYNPNKDCLEMVYPNEVVWQKHKGDMISIKSGNTDQLLTSNHRVLSFTEAGYAKESIAKDFKPLGDRYFKLASKFDGGISNDKDDFLKLVVATQADGYLSKDCSAIIFSFTRVEKYKRLIQILNSLEADFTESKFFRKNREELTVRLKSSSLTRQVRSWLGEKKQFTYKLLGLSVSMRKLIIEELRYWDGTLKSNGDLILDQTSKESIDIIQGVCASIGIKSKVNSYNKLTSFGKCKIYRVYISTATKPITQLRSCKSEVVKYEGYVGCVSVPSTFVLVRRNGKVFISGNTLTGIKMGIPRDQAKSVNYAILYGASANKFVSMLGMTKSEAEQFYSDYWDSNPALKALKNDKDKEWMSSGKESIKSIDGRRIRIRSQHSILNALFQSAGVICAKYITVKLCQKMEALGYIIDPFKGVLDFSPMIEYHDENQTLIRPDLLSFKKFKTKEDAKLFCQEWKGEQLGAIQEGKEGSYYITLPSVLSMAVTESIKEVEEMFKMKVELGYEYVTGRDWYACH